MAAISESLDNETRATGYLVGYQPLRYVKRWPESSPKPFRLYAAVPGAPIGKGWRFVAAYSTAERLESAWRARLESK